MEIIRSTFHILREYLDGTYPPQMFILSMELGIVAISISQADPKIFGELKNFLIRWHTIFLGPITIGEPLLPFFEGIWPGGKMPNLMISLLSIIEISLFSTSPGISISLLTFMCLVYLIDNSNSLIMILISILFGYSFYILRELFGPSRNNKLPFLHLDENLQHPINYFEHDYNECIYTLTSIFTLIAVLTQFRANNMKDTSNYHSILIRNLGFIAFDSIIHYFGSDNCNYVMFAFFSNFFLIFLSRIMSFYLLSFSF